MKDRTHMNILDYFACGLLGIGLLTAVGCSKRADYTDPTQSVEKRVEDLLGRMTLEEKVAQMNQFVGLEHMRNAAVALRPEELKKSHAMGFYADYPPEEVERMTARGEVGSFLHVLSIEEANHLQQLAQQSRLGIPLLIGIDAIHGNGMLRGSTVYPTPIGQAATFDPALVERLSRETALEMRATGSHWTFTPNVEVARDPRWGRVGETFGEDPVLVGAMGAATVRGFQTDTCAGEDKVLACAKHLIGGSQPENGINGAPCDISERTLREVFLPPFRACIEAGSETVMAAHNDLNGIPCHANKYLMSDILRGEWGFEGFFVSDWMDVERLEDYHRICDSQLEAFRLAVEAGIDFHMHGPDFYFGVIELVKSGKLSEKRIDEAVRKVLSAKFRLGLFENPFVDTDRAREVLFCEEHRQTALDVARRSIVLLRNEGGLLPIDTRRFKRILLTGPNADNQSILGDWSVEQPAERVVTIRQGLEALRPDVQFTFAGFTDDFDLQRMRQEEVDRAVRAARGQDLAIVVVGENSMRYHWSVKTCGENTDRYDLSLAGLQQQLVERIAATGIPVVVVLVNGRPMSTEWIAEHIPAVVEAWEPGSLGGRAVAEVLFGEVNPSGKMPITAPRHAGQIACYYNHRFTSKWFPYATGNSAPLYDFGYGLSYTTFRCGAPAVDRTYLAAGQTCSVSVEVTNTGDRAGEEVVQLYVSDVRSSATRPMKELKAFRRIALEPGQTTTVTFTVTPEMLSMYDAAMHYGIEPGDFVLRTGTSSRDADLQSVRITVR